MAQKKSRRKRPQVAARTACISKKQSADVVTPCLLSCGEKKTSGRLRRVESLQERRRSGVLLHQPQSTLANARLLVPLPNTDRRVLCANYTSSSWARQGNSYYRSAIHPRRFRRIDTVSSGANWISPHLRPTPSGPRSPPNGCLRITLSVSPFFTSQHSSTPSLGFLAP